MRGAATNADARNPSPQPSPRGREREKRRVVVSTRAAEFSPMSFTPAQTTAIAARGNVLVIAGAGTGKTRTLIERCLQLLREGASLDRLLLVTFTEAAAAEMRARLRTALQEELKT